MAALLLVCGPVRGQATTRGELPTRTELLCAADRPVVHPGESVVVRGWIVGAADEAAAERRRWQWQPALGSVLGDDVATWRFGPGDLPKEGSTVMATVEVAIPGRPGPPLSCEVEVVLAEKRLPSDGDTRGNEITAHAFLLNGQPPPPGYGMYSYLLLDPPADDTERRRHIHAIAMYLMLIPSAVEMRAHLRPGSFNLALLPVKREIQLPSHLMGMDEAHALASEVLRHYDFGAAQELLRSFCVDVRGSGPYLVASRDRDGCRRSRVLLDMTQTLPDLVPHWIRTFRSLATAERSWGNDTMTELMLRTRNVIAVSYRGVASAAQDLPRRVRMLD